MSVSKRQLLEHMRSFAHRPLAIRELARQLAVPPLEYRSFRRLIRKMVQAGEIVRIKGHKYGLPTKLNLVVGRLQVHPEGFGFLIPEEKEKAEVYISSRNLKLGMDGDKVVVRVEQYRRGQRPAGKVIRVLERAHQQLVGRYERGYQFDYVIPWHPNITQDIFIPPHSHDAEPGQLVVAEITKYPTGYRNPEGRIVEVLGNPEDAGIDEEVIIRHYQLPREFPADVLAEAEQIPDAICDKEIKRRLDLRGLRLFTIDGETARDFDDAVSIEELGNGNLRLGVHIADVSHYVAPGSALDEEAYRRGNSVYFPDRALPMLPPALSCGICSLNPQVDRLSISVFMEFDSAANLVSYEFADSVIRSCQRFTYKQVMQILTDKQSPAHQDYRALVPDLERMRELAQRLKSRRISRGSLDFDLPEPEVILDLEGVTQGIIKRERNIAHEIIEEFMLVANEVVASYIADQQMPLIYRIHEEPDEIKLKEFLDYVSHLGHSVTIKGRIKQPQIQRILTEFKGKPEEQLVALIMLRSLKLAKYSAANVGHFALATACYTHFTSPIRRYPDLVVHRLLRELRLKGRPGPVRCDELVESLPQVADHCSYTERLAETAERDIIKIKRIKFMSDKVGDEFEGIISGVTSFGLFVELMDFYIEGLIHVSTLTDDFYHYKQRQQALVGERTKRKFCLGERVRVRVDKVDLDRRFIDFSLLSKLG
jgi:ribonuclease R